MGAGRVRGCDHRARRNAVAAHPARCAVRVAGDANAGQQSRRTATPHRTGECAAGVQEARQRLGTRQAAWPAAHLSLMRVPSLSCTNRSTSHTPSSNTSILP